MWWTKWGWRPICASWTASSARVAPGYCSPSRPSPSSPWRPWSCVISRVSAPAASTRRGWDERHSAARSIASPRPTRSRNSTRSSRSPITSSSIPLVSGSGSSPWSARRGCAGRACATGCASTRNTRRAGIPSTTPVPPCRALASPAPSSRATPLKASVASTSTPSANRIYPPWPAPWRRWRKASDPGWAAWHGSISAAATISPARTIRWTI